MFLDGPCTERKIFGKEGKVLTGDCGEELWPLVGLLGLSTPVPKKRKVLLT